MADVRPLVSAETLADLHDLLERLQVTCSSVHDNEGNRVAVLGFDLSRRLKQAIRDTRDAWMEALRRETV